MITDALIELTARTIFIILSWDIWGNTSLFSAEVHSAALTLGENFGLIDFIVPTTTLALAVGAVYSIDIAMWTWRTIRWIMTHIPFIGGR